MRRTHLVLAAVASLLSTAAAAVAADLPPRPRPIYKAPAPAYVTYNWTGFYLGGHVGYGWSTVTGTDPTDGSRSSGRLRGFLGGGQIGYNYQIGSFVLGIEGDYSWADVKRTDVVPPLTTTLKHDFFATAAGRLGYAADRWLWYAKGGGAWTRDRLEANDTVDTIDAKFNRSGWMAGAGIEYAFWNNWSTKVEYNYLHFGKINESAVGTGGLTADAIDVSAEIHLVKLGINYKFF
jgi:outer membrane immunogenic protein